MLQKTGLRLKDKIYIKDLENLEIVETLDLRYL